MYLRQKEMTAIWADKMAHKKVMILDDDKEFLEELQETLSLSGYDPIAINDTDGFMAAVERVKPDVILLDLKMPKKTGFQIAFELKEYAQNARVPVIAMSAFVKEGYVSLMELCGIKKCLRKPFNPLDIIAEIEKQLSETRG